MNKISAYLRWHMNIPMLSYPVLEYARSGFRSQRRTCPQTKVSVRVPDFDNLKIPFFLRSDNQYIVKSADFSGWIASPFRAFERSFVHRCKQVGWIISKVRNCLVFEPDFRHGGLKAGGQDKYMEIIPHCQSLGRGVLFRQRFLMGMTWHLMDGVLQLEDL